MSEYRWCREDGPVVSRSETVGFQKVRLTGSAGNPTKSLFLVCATVIQTRML